MRLAAYLRAHQVVNSADPVFEDLLPPGAVADWWCGQLPLVDLLPAEEAVSQGYAIGRRAEFAAVRWCARRAMSRLGVPPKPIISRGHGCPSWPAGVIGSMSHCSGMVVAVVALDGVLSSLGVDVEPHRALPHDVRDLVLSPCEQDRHKSLSRRFSAVHWDTIVFSVKESVYKAWYPLRQEWLDFSDVEVHIDAALGWYRANIVASRAEGGIPAISQINGRWAIRTGFVITTAAVLGPLGAGENAAVGNKWTNYRQPLRPRART